MTATQREKRSQQPKKPNNKEQSISLSLIDPSSLALSLALALSLSLSLALASCVPGFSIVRFSHNLILLQIHCLLLDPQTVSPFFL